MNEKSLEEIMQIVSLELSKLYRARADAMGYINPNEEIDCEIEYFAQLLGIFSILS